MNTLNHLKGNFIISGTAVGLGVFSKYAFHKEFIPVSSEKQVFYSFLFILGTTIAGKLLMDKLYQEHWVPYSAGGKNKVENEGFIGPLQGDLIYLISPNRWDNRANPDRWNQDGN